MLPISVGLVVSSLATGQLVARTGMVLSWAVCGMTGMSLVLAGFSLVPGLSLHAILFGLFFIGLGMGTVLGPVQIVVQLAAAASDLGSASSTIHVSRLMGAACGTALSSTILYVVLSRDPSAQALFEGLMTRSDVPAEIRPGTFDAAFSAIFGAIALMALACAAVAASVPLRKL